MISRRCNRKVGEPWGVFWSGAACALEMAEDVCPQLCAEATSSHLGRHVWRKVHRDAARARFPDAGGIFQFRTGCCKRKGQSSTSSQGLPI